LVAHWQEAGKRAMGPIGLEEMAKQAQALLEEGPCSFVVLSNGDFGGLHKKLISLVEAH